MANRPVYVPITRPPFYRVANVDFEFNPGFSVSQKQKNIEAIHNAFLRHSPDSTPLEISSKSLQPLGVNLSAFLLKKRIPSLNITIPVENAYQGAKKFACGGPYTDLYCVSPKDAKRDGRLTTSGPLRAFTFEGVDYPLEPKNGFYDWLYIQALHENPEYAEQVLSYNAFTDVEFNPNKSINCQARAAAMFVGITNAESINKTIDFFEFCQLVSGKVAVNTEEVKATQMKFFLKDITTIDTDAIVNATDKKLSGGGGIDKAIHIAAGANNMRAALDGQILDVGEALITDAFDLPAKYVIHAVGPRFRGGNSNEKAQLAKTYISCLDIAKKAAIKSITFCSISTGTFHFPLSDAAEIAISTIMDWLKNNKSTMDISFAFLDARTKSAYEVAYHNHLNKDKEPVDKKVHFRTDELIVHPTFGEGKITQVNDEYLNILFACGEKIIGVKWAQEHCKY